MTTYESASPSRASNGPLLILWAGCCAVAAIAFVAYTQAVLIALGLGAIFLAYGWLVPARLALWQALAASSLAGFIVLNYGFENLVVAHVGSMPLLIGEFTMFVGLVLAIRTQTHDQLAPLLRDRIAHGFLFLLFLSAIHLCVDVPRYGLFAFRDASPYIEAMFLIAGYIWASSVGGIKRFLEFLLLVFALTALYAFTLPFSDALQSASPKSGVFQPIAVLGQYQQIGLYLAAGAIFCAWFAEKAQGWPRRVLYGMSIVQICGLAVTQNRSMYLGLLVIIAALSILGEKAKLKRCLKVIGLGTAATVALVLMASLLRLNIEGRVGAINGEFLSSYALSIFSVDSANSRLGRDDDRVDWMRQTWNSTVADPLTLVAGQGFGKPLLDAFETETGMQVREPHNAIMGVFGRLGVLGVLAWVAVQVAFLKRLVRGLRKARGERRDLILWLLVFFILALVMAMVQPAWEFSHFAVPVYFMIGFTMKLLKPQAVIQRGR